jgi:hypothetical protein
MHAHEEGGHDDGHSSHSEHGDHSEPQDFDANIQVMCCDVMSIAHITSTLDSSYNATPCHRLIITLSLPSSACNCAVGCISPRPHRPYTEYRSSNRWHGTFDTLSSVRQYLANSAYRDIIAIAALTSSHSER